MAPKNDIFPLTCKHTAIGQVFVVGSGDCGQLGLGDDVFEKERPARVKYFDDKNIVAVYAGGMHNIALDDKGRLYSWGCNDQRALGREGEETEPGEVVSLKDHVIVDVACGDSVSCALTNQGRVYIWGTFRNNTGIFGMEGGLEAQPIPTLVDTLQGVVSISSGSNHCIAVTYDGKTHTWGVGDQGQLGRKIMPRQVMKASLVPRNIAFKPRGLSSKFTKAFCGSYHTFIVHEKNNVYACGLNNFGQLGMGTNADDDEENGGINFDLEEVLGLNKEEGVAMICGGEHHSMLLTENGKVYTFGRGDSGQLGLPSQTHQKIPQHLSSLPPSITRISCGSAFSLALSADEQGDNLYMWGYGEMGQLANNSVDAPIPFKVDLNGRFVLDASAGGQHTLMLLRPKN